MGALIAAGLAGILGRAAPVRADGAFPNSRSVLLARDRPKQIVLATTFGLVFSEDDGVSWLYSCENNATRTTTEGGPYVMGPPPDDRIYVVSDVGAPVTADGACTWSLGGGALTGVVPSDVFPDPSDSGRVFALARNPVDGLVSVYRSMDGGLTYAAPIFTSPAEEISVNGVEVAAAGSRTVFLTLYQTPGMDPLLPPRAPLPHLAKSDDGGDTWATIDIEPGVGSVVPSLVAVDPVDSRKVYLRIVDSSADPFEGLAISSDAGMSWTIPLKIAGGTLVGFARLPDGTLFVVGSTVPTTLGATAIPLAFRSDDGGLTFVGLPFPYHPRGLAQRSGTLFVATDNFLDGLALASSDDAGQSWKPRFRFREIAGIKDCVRASCQDDCDFFAGIKLFPVETCNPQVLPPPPKPGGGCGCGMTPWGGVFQMPAGAVVPVLVAAFLGRSRRRMRGR